MSAAFEVIDGTPNYNLYVGGKWIRSSRNEAAESRNPAMGELFARVQQAGAAETAATPVSAREAVFFRGRETDAGSHF
jgi:vanillin dehydrogenase